MSIGPPEPYVPPVMWDLIDERDRQNAKWGEQNHPDGTGPEERLLDDALYDTFASLEVSARERTDRQHRQSRATFTDILLEEVFEALAEDDPVRLRTELVQVAAVCVQWIEKIDRQRAAGG